MAKIESMKFGPPKTSRGGGAFLKPKTGDQFVFEYQGTVEYSNHFKGGEMEKRHTVAMLETGEAAILPSWGAIRALLSNAVAGKVYRLTIGAKGAEATDPWECTLEAAE